MKLFKKILPKKTVSPTKELILVLNSGSSSIKFELFVNSNLNSICEGLFDAIGLKHCHLEINWNSNKIDHKILVKDHKKALSIIFEQLITNKIIDSLKDIHAVGHRIVHGGENYQTPILIDNKVTKSIKKLSELAPLHNPANLEGILACQKILKKIPNIGIFDTAFHQTIPEQAYLYGLPYELYQKHHLRRYGFHGINHQFVTQETIHLLKSIKKPKIITCHLGNGSSIAASINGQCIDTSMGFTPLEGLVMGTRCGDIDPSIVPYLMQHKKMNVQQIENLLNHESGLKGVSQTSSDMRILYANSKITNKKDKKFIAATRAMNLFSYRIAKYIGAYTAALNGVDAIVFTAGIGEKAWYIRRDILKHLEYLGLKFDPAKNRKCDLSIHHPNSKVKIFIIPANEELQIAREVKKMLY